ncbi:hypothetical protein MY7_0240 [Bacillus sp. CN2]|nr:hypothetical protein U471_03940 [Bacillus amyloliquefaciens CC178]ANF35303.1 hypothetical protein BCBMB205_03980 [Bacillus velezensis]EIF11953.1 hypothetical protein MY7_0240 [Bacillus sp. 5B6]KYC87531.1 hypothetical protein B4140_0666 [Bacillus amyloliquefaciens]GFR56338.1 hypothetical protein MY7_0240 [Bacillus sp. CN2]
MYLTFYNVVVSILIHMTHRNKKPLPAFGGENVEEKKY